MEFIYCKECGKKISIKDYKCPYCGALYFCNKCGENVGIKDKKCPHCGEQFKEGVGLRKIIEVILKILLS